MAGLSNTELALIGAVILLALLIAWWIMRRPAERVRADTVDVLTPGLQIGDLKIDREKYIVTSNNEEITLARKEFELLALLTSKPSKVFLRNEILHKVWGTDVIVGDRTIDVHIRKIRQKLGGDCITTVKGVGYKFQI